MRTRNVKLEETGGFGDIAIQMEKDCEKEAVQHSKADVRRSEQPVRQILSFTMLMNEYFGQSRA
jgi:hypothetical protein